MSFYRGNFSNNATYDLNATVPAPVNSMDNFALLSGKFNVYYTPFLIVLGCLGNLVSVFVFYSSKLRYQSTSQYLTALAISDTLFLLQLLLPWLNALQLSDLFNQNGFCQIFVYTSYVTCCLSAWLVVAFTVERFVAVLYPLQRTAVCTIKRARTVILSLTGGALVINVPVLRFATIMQNVCDIDVAYMDYAEKFNLVDTMVTFTLPLLVIIVLNTWIMVGVVRLERTRQLLMKADDGLTSQQRARRAFTPPCPRSQQRVTRMLLIVSSVFVILNLPGYAFRILAYAYPAPLEETSSNQWAALQQIAHMFFNTNFGINFFLYCLSGQNFRRALSNTLPWIRKRALRSVALRRMVSFHPPRASSVSSNPSFVSNCTEATVNCATFPTPSAVRRRRQEPYITRWTFDNSGQKQAMQQHQGSQHRPLYHHMQQQVLHEEMERAQQNSQRAAQSQVLEHQAMTHEETPRITRFRSLRLRQDNSQSTRNQHDRADGARHQSSAAATRQQAIQMQPLHSRPSTSREAYEMKIFMGDNESSV